MKKCIVILLTICCMLLFSNAIYASEEKEFITRAEMANIVVTTYEEITQTYSVPIIDGCLYEDLDATVPYAYKIEQAYSKFMRGVGNHKFMPYAKVDNEQAITVVYRLLQALNQKYDVELERDMDIIISDEEDISPWAVEAVKYVVSVHAVERENGKVNPHSNMTKQQMSEVIRKIKDMYLHQAGILSI